MCTRMTGSSNLHQFNKELHGSAQQYNGRINSCHIIYVSRPVGATLKSVGLENSIRVSGKNNVRIVMADTVGMTVLDSIKNRNGLSHRNVHRKRHYDCRRI